ncbi:hypothetical protein RQP46_002991 [Phenoliferia psychrophenolica]
MVASPSPSSSSNGFAAFAHQPVALPRQGPAASTSAFASASAVPPPAWSKAASPTSPQFKLPIPIKSNLPALTLAPTSQPHLRVDPARAAGVAVQSQQRSPLAQNLGRVPIINTGAAARTPSGYLLSPSESSSPGPSPSSASGPGQGINYYRMQSASVSAQTGKARQGGPAPGAPRFVPYQVKPSLLAIANANASAIAANGAHSVNGNGNGKGKGREVLDLTSANSDSDDDIVIDETPICIGQVTSLALILYPVQDLQPPQPVLPTDDHGRPIPIPENIPLPIPPQPPLPIHIYRGPMQGANETLRLSTPVSHETFGVMEHRVANVVAPLFGDGYCGTGVTKDGNGKMWCEASVVRRGERNPMMLPLNLLLFARPIDINYISDTLDHANIFLEHPSTYSPAMHNGYRYSNPHNPAPGVGGGDRRRQQFLNGLQGGGAAYRAPVKAQDVARQQVEDVFQKLTSGVDLDEEEPAPSVATKLYPHQKQALSFLLDRERLIDVPATATQNDETIVALWKRKVDPYNRPVGWMNVVADLEIKGSQPPPQPRGSILADDMGLGKTIVVISLIAATLPEATAWATEVPGKEKIDPRFDGVSNDKGKARVTLSDFSSHTFGADTNGSQGKALSKKKEAKLKRERKREDAVATRFARLVTRSRGTLIVCPLSTVQNWESQIEEHVLKTAGMSVYVYHGNTRLSDPLKLADYDVVVTTFSTLGTEFSKQSRAEDEREEDELAAQASAAQGSGLAHEDSSDEQLDVYDLNGQLVDKPKPPVDKGGKKKRKRKKVEGSGASPLQQIQWFRVVLDEAHIIKEHTTIQARAACDLSSQRRTALSGTPLQNSLNDLFSLVRFLRLEPFTDRAVWTQHIGALAKNGDPLGVSRLQLIMRHLALRRTKASVDKDGKPILSLPPNNQKIVHLAFDPAEHAFYSSHHNRYKHDFKKLVESDSVMKNYCSILQELLRLRQICVHMSLVRDSEDLAGVNGDVASNIDKHGISKPRAMQLLGLLRDAGGAQCCECGHDMIPAGAAAAAANDEMATEPIDKKPPKKSRKTTKSATASAACSDNDQPAEPVDELKSVVTRCQHLFCRVCFRDKVYNNWPDNVGADDRASCTVCKADLTPALDAVEIGAREMERAFETAADEDLQAASGKKVKGTRFFEHSTKTKSLIADVYPFSQANPASANFWGGMDLEEPKTKSTGGTIGFQPVKGEVVKSVVFSQWTKLLDRLGDALDQQNIKYGRLDGGMNRDQRTKAMDTFKTDPSCEILLVSLRAGGVGLNLTVARRVYLMEPFWNPAVENQAIDRIHRLGQTMPVQTVRYIIQDSIEQNMLKIQQRKMDLAK